MYDKRFLTCLLERYYTILIHALKSANSDVIVNTNPQHRGLPKDNTSQNTAASSTHRGEIVEICGPKEQLVEQVAEMLLVALQTMMSYGKS